MNNKHEETSNCEENCDSADRVEVYSKTFKTSWGTEYTLQLKKGASESSSDPTIDALIEKSRSEKLAAAMHQRELSP